MTDENVTVSVEADTSAFDRALTDLEKVFVKLRLKPDNGTEKCNRFRQGA